MSTIDDDETNEVTDEILASLLEENNHTEAIEHTAATIATFYGQLRKDIELYSTPQGEIHDAALEITKEWLSYILS